MAKKSSSSWLTIVKRAFRSPTKENEKRSSKRRDEHDQEEEEKVTNIEEYILSMLSIFTMQITLFYYMKSYFVN